MDRHFHVRLSRTKPYVAYINIFQGKPILPAFYLHSIWTSKGEFIQKHLPITLPVSFYLFRLTTQTNPDRFILICPSPNFNRFVSLQNHIVREKTGKLDFRPKVYQHQTETNPQYIFTILHDFPNIFKYKEIGDCCPSPSPILFSMKTKPILIEKTVCYSLVTVSVHPTRPAGIFNSKT